MAKWFYCGVEGCNFKHRHPAPVNAHRFHTHGVVSEKTKKPKGSEKCDQCDYTGSSFGLAVHRAKAHGMAKRSKHRGSDSSQNQLMVIPPPRSNYRGRSVAMSPAQSGVVWQFCPCCGVDLQAATMTIAAAMTVANARR